MTAYQSFINCSAGLKENELFRLWELEIEGKIEDMIDFVNEFLRSRGLKYTGYKKEDGICKAVYNYKYIFNGAIQDGNKIAIRLKTL